MNKSEKTRELLTKHFETHPELQIRDIFKYIFQSSFGCEHLVSSFEKVAECIIAEYETIDKSSAPYIEALDGNYSRVYLSYMNTGLSAQTLGKLFFLSARKEPEGKTSLNEKIEVTKELVKENILPFTAEDFEKELNKWQAENFPAVHHSEEFRKVYKPTYRVIANEYIPFLPLFANIDKMLSKGSVKLAVEGGSASGKTTLGKILESIYDCTVLHMDDFFLQPHQRTPERYKEIGGNIDRERFLSEVLHPLSRNEDISYRRFDCSSMSIKKAEIIAPKQLTVIEGAYSMHPEFSKYYDLSVFLDITAETQKKRILHRNTPEMATRFFNEWIPYENNYFSKTNVKEKCGLCIEIK